MNHIFTMYWRNVPYRIVEGQRSVLRSMNFEVKQCETSGIQHGAWIDSVISGIAEGDSLLLIDIDAIPMRKAIIDRAFAEADRGHIFGVAQTANHLRNPFFIYAAPSFLCFSKRTWRRIGSPSFCADESCDVAGRLSLEAKRAGVRVRLIFPNHVLIPKWQLGDRGCLGIGTFYEEMSVFHLFEARNSKLSGYDWIFDEIANHVLTQRHLDIVGLDAKVRSIQG